MRRLATVGVAVLVLAGCGSGVAPSASAPSRDDCATADAAGVITLSANGLRFSAPCMIAPVGTAFTIRFVNREAVPHDVAIYDDATKVNEEFRGAPITGPNVTIDYSIPALPAGEYFFNCTIHPPDMHGALYVEAGDGSRS